MENVQTFVSDGLRRLRTLSALGDLQFYSDEDYQSRLVCFAADGQINELPQLNLQRRCLCLVISGRVEKWTEQGKETFDSGQVFVSDIFVPHQILGIFQEDVAAPQLFIIPFFQDIAVSARLHIEKLTSYSAAGIEVSDDFGELLWSYILRLRSCKVGDRAYKRSLLRRMYVNAILVQGIEPGVLLERIGRPDKPCYDLAFEFCRNRQDAEGSLPSNRPYPIEEYSFHRKFSSIFGVSPKIYQNKIRILHAQRISQSRDLSMSSLSQMVGYSSPRQLKKDIKSSCA